ncbi:MAG: FAD-dependent oxidoreductase [Sporomusaceae bacterium]|nr:FAD-dependent oxidoreductase [Sporomusaceae bacterium]
MKRTTVVIIGGGAIGVGILRDLSLRGVKAILIAEHDLGFGASSGYPGLLHSGGRYAVHDPGSAKECAAENAVLRKIGRHCIEENAGYFIRLPEDDPSYEGIWVKACKAAGIPVAEARLEDAHRLEPNLTARAEAIYKLPDASVDVFRLCRQNVLSAQKHGGHLLTFSEVTAIERTDTQVDGVRIRNSLTGQIDTICCDYIINAAGAWGGKVARLAGITLSVTLARRTLIYINHRFTNRIINRLHRPAPGDTFVPYDSMTILGTAYSPAEKPDDFVPTTEEVVALINTGKVLFEDLPYYHIFRTCTEIRPQYRAEPGVEAGDRPCKFELIDHSRDGLHGFASVIGGKLTTYRLLAEKIADFICEKLSIRSTCQTSEEPIIDVP